MNESLLDDLGQIEKSSSQELADRPMTWPAHFILTAIGHVYVTEERHFEDEATVIPFSRMCHQWQDVVGNCAFVRDTDLNACIYCIDALRERIKDFESFDADRYMMVNLSGERQENSFKGLCDFVLKEKHEICPQEKSTKVCISMSCGIMPNKNVTLKQIIKGIKNIKKFSEIFRNVMRDLLINTDSITLTYSIPGNQDKSIVFYIDEKMGIRYGTLYKLAANITGDEDKYSVKRLEQDYKKATSDNPDEFSTAVSEHMFVPEFIKKIARDMQADPDFEWSIATYKAKDPLNPFPQMVIWVEDVNQKKDKISVLRNRLRTIFTGFTYFEQKEIRAQFNSSDARRQHGMHIYIVFNTDRISLPESQCNPDKEDYEFRIFSDATDFVINILDSHYYQFSNSMKSDAKVDAYYRRYTTIERTVSDNDLKKTADPESLSRIQGELVELRT